MSNAYGQAARQAYDPHMVLRYIAHLEKFSCRTAMWEDAYHGRTIRRWRSAKGVTPWGLDGVLTGYDRNRASFEAWAGPAGRLRG